MLRRPGTLGGSYGNRCATTGHDRGNPCGYWVPVKFEDLFAALSRTAADCGRTGSEPPPLRCAPFRRGRRTVGGVGRVVGRRKRNGPLQERAVVSGTGTGAEPGRSGHAISRRRVPLRCRGPSRRADGRVRGLRRGVPRGGHRGTSRAHRRRRTRIPAASRRRDWKNTDAAPIVRSRLSRSLASISISARSPTSSCSG